MLQKTPAGCGPGLKGAADGCKAGCRRRSGRGLRVSPEPAHDYWPEQVGGARAEPSAGKPAALRVVRVRRPLDGPRSGLAQRHVCRRHPDHRRG